MKQPYDEALETVELAVEVLETVRRSLMMSFRFLDRALFKMQFEPREGIELIGCDGKTVYFDATSVLQRYQDSPDECVRDYLHMIFHCLFYHPFIGNDISPHIWGVSCDIVVEQAAMDLAGTRYESAQDERRRQYIDAFTAKIGNLSAEKLYQNFIEQGVDAKELLLLEALFTRDDHGIWFHDRDQEKAHQEENDNQESSNFDKQQMAEDAPDAPFDDPHDIPDMIDAGGQYSERPNRGEGSQSDTAQDTEAENGDEKDSEAEEEHEPVQHDEAQLAKPQEQDDAPMEQDSPERFDDGPDGNDFEAWENISKQMKVDLETRSREYGSKAGSLVQHLAISNRPSYDYRDFLRRFAEIGEEMRVSDTEFDLIYYSYGLERYGNMPLIEPLEYREVERIREFVIAIDTSGSVKGALVKRFVEETFSILTSMETFFDDVRIRIIQCDARVQHETLITSTKDFEQYMRTFQVRGFGGTDFRPVFARVDTYIELGEIEHLKGLIYFTDGHGSFPERPPAYETVFVFVGDGAYTPKVPPWAYKLVLSANELLFE